MTRNGFSPLRDIMSLRDSMDRLLEDRWVSPGSSLTWSTLGGNYLPLDIYETPDDLVLRAVLPGIAADKIDIQFQGGVLTLRAKSDEPTVPDGSTWLVREVMPAEYIRQVTLPRTIDPEKARTSFDHGVLTLTLPKTADARPKQIKVSSAAEVGSGTSEN